MLLLMNATATTWNKLWTTYTAARRAGNDLRAGEAAMNMKLWHEAQGLPVPAWLGAR